MQYQMVWDAIIRAKKQHALSHAYLLYGDPLITLEDFARKLAAAIQCEQSGENGEVCGSCQYCLAHIGKYPLDVYILQRTEGELSIRIDQVRDFITDITKTTHGGRRIGLIIGIDVLSDEAQEALLKTLEEPAPETMIIVLAQDKRQIPATILSRCQQWYCYSGEMDESQRVIATSDWETVSGVSLYEKMRWAQEVASDDDPIGRVQNILKYGESLLATPHYLELAGERATMVSMLGCITQALERLHEAIGSRRLILEVCVLELSKIYDRSNRITR